ncbi:MAG TPA: hypothetical protein VK563_14665 [Puia sp.]|nr:hypothetical protein [Puia sp.]
MTRQNPMTLVTPVIHGSHDRLDAYLKSIRTDLEKGLQEPFETLGNIHYARWILLEPEEADTKAGTHIGARLVFSSDFDGSEDNHLTGLVSGCPDLIDNMYSCCKDYPAPGARTVESRKQYLRQWRVKMAASFVGAPGRALGEVRQESLLRNYIWNFIHKGDWKGRSAVEIHTKIKTEISARPEFLWAKEPVPLPKIRWLGMALLGIILLILSPLILIWIVLIHFLYERSDKPLGLTPSQIDETHVRKLEEYEDLENQNQFTQVLVMKPAKMRVITLQGLMLFAKSLIKNLFVNGKLMGIPTIHFARWVMIDNNKRMLFFSNFDGSWQQYLGDFIDKSGWGLTGIWSNTVNFPRTKFLFTGGAYDEEHFLAWSRYYQVPTAVWYCAYPHLSIKNVMNNSYIRNELMQELSEKKAQQFLQRF